MNDIQIDGVRVVLNIAVEGRDFTSYEAWIIFDNKTLNPPIDDGYYAGYFRHENSESESDFEQRIKDACIEYKDFILNLAQRNHKRYEFMLLSFNYAYKTGSTIEVEIKVIGGSSEIISINKDELLAKYGQEGWQLVSVQDYQESQFEHYYMQREV